MIGKFGSQGSQDEFMSSHISDLKKSKESFLRSSQSKKRGNQTLSSRPGVLTSSPDGADTILNSSVDNRYDFADSFKD